MSETHSITENQPALQGYAAYPQSTGNEAKMSFFFIWLFIAAIYARPEDIFPVVGEFHLTFILGTCATAAFLWSVLLGDVSVVWPRELQIVLMLTAWFIVGVPFAYWRGGSFAVLTQEWLKTLLIFYLMTQTLVSLARIRAILWAIILSELVVTAYSLAATSQVRWIGGRLFGVSLGVLGGNFLGIAAALTIPYIAALFITHPSFLKSGLLAAAIMSMLWMLVQTASRSGMLTVIFSMVVTSFLVLRGTNRGKVIGIGIIIVLLVAIVTAPRIFWERMGTMVADDSTGPADMAEASAEMSDDHRMDVLVRSIDYTLDHPIFGLGLGNLGIVGGNELGQVPEAYVGAHNTFTQISSEAGLPALLLFLWLLSTVWRSMKQIGQTVFVAPESVELNLMARATLGSLLSFAFGAFFAHIGYEYYLYTCPIAIGVGIRHVARTMQAAPMAPPESSTSSPMPQFTEEWTA
jgi:O-antigen ligase